jgi:hypothetical protein
VQQHLLFARQEERAALQMSIAQSLTTPKSAKESLP